MPVIGLTGSIGAGKSRVAAALAGRGALVLDADQIGHVLLDQPPARDRVVKRFGAQVLDPAAPSGAPRIDRRTLGAIVFSDPAARRDLEAILHPRMRQTFQRAIARTARQGTAPAVVLDAAVLFEAGWNDLCDAIVLVDAAPATRLARLAAQRGWSAEILAARELAQWPLESKRCLSNHVLTNDADEAALEAAVAQLWPVLTQPARRRAPARPVAAHRPNSAERRGSPAGKTASRPPRRS